MDGVSQARARSTSFSSGDERKLIYIWLSGVKETLPGLVYRQCSLMDLGVDDLQQDM